MHVRELIQIELDRVVKMLNIDLPFESIIVEQPPQLDMGDYACTIALSLARKIKCIFAWNARHDFLWSESQS